MKFFSIKQNKKKVNKNFKIQYQFQNSTTRPNDMIHTKVGKIAEHIEYRNAEIVEEVKKNAKVPSNDTTDFKLSRRSRTQCVKFTYFFYLIIAIVNLIKK